MKTLGMFSLVILSVALLAAGPMMAQQADPQGQPDATPASSQQTTEPDATAQGHAPDQASGSATRTGGPACWHQAGISMKAMRTRASIMANAKTKIQNVNDDTSLTPQQQKRQIRQIRQNARQQIAKLVTPEQETTLRQCQLQRKPNAAPPSNPPETTPPAPQPN